MLDVDFQELRSKRIESSCEDSKASPSKPFAPVNLSGDKRTDVDSYDHELEQEYGYSKGKQVRQITQKKELGLTKLILMYLLC